MTLVLKKAVVVDDSLGPPAIGAVDADDKDAWIDAIIEDSVAQRKLFEAFPEIGDGEIEHLLEKLASDANFLRKLWDLYRNGVLAGAHLETLFKTESLNRLGKSDKANVVRDTLVEMIGEENVYCFDSLDGASQSLVDADIAFIDFYFSENESDAAALDRIKNASDVLRQPKLLFFMSSRASVKLQQEIRKLIQVKTAFFEVMRKTDIDPIFIQEKIRSKSHPFKDNRALQDIVSAVVAATKSAGEELEKECETLEIHDLRILNLMRLSNEDKADGALSEYLIWLISEAIAAKIRRIGVPATTNSAINNTFVGFTGQIGRNEVLFDLFSEVVFSPPPSADEALRFGEILKRNETEGSYLLVISPACDLVRCAAEYMVLCVDGQGQDCSDPMRQASEKLYGKLDSGLRHFYMDKSNEGSVTSTLFSWSNRKIHTYSNRELISGGFTRIALMNEIFAQEVKEFVLRELGRVGTPINPPPHFALHARLRWNNGVSSEEAETPKDLFISALLTYSEADAHKAATIILSEEFQAWATKTIMERVGAKGISPKLQGCIDTMNKEVHYPLKNKSCKRNDLIVRVVDVLDEDDRDTNKALLEIALFTSIDGD